MNTEGRRRVVALCYLLPLLAGSVVLSLTLFVMASRWDYPYELEWIESGMLQVVDRLLHGLPLYAPPTMDYVPPLYAPLYFHVSAWFAGLLGDGLPALRAVSALAALITAGITSASVWLVTRDRFASVLAVFAWGALYRFSGNWYDVGRVDSLWACFLMAALFGLLLCRYRRWGAGVHLSAVALALAILTKQTALLLLPCYVLAVFCWCDRQTAIRYCLVLALALLSLGGWWQWQSGGLFFYYTMQMAGGHHFNPGVPMNFLEGDLLFGVPVWCLLSLGFLFVQRRDIALLVGWLAIFSGFLVVALLGRWYSGGFLNVLIPLHQLLVVMGLAAFSGFVHNTLQSTVTAIRKCLYLLPAVFLLSFNLAWGWFNAAWLIPKPEDRVCGDRLVERLRAVEGGVCVSRHPYLAILAGKPACAHEAFAVDVINGSDKSLSAALATDIREKLRAGYYKVLLLDNQAQFEGYGVDRFALPYTAMDIDCPAERFFPVIRGQRPRHWLDYNGSGWDDRRSEP